MANERKEEKKKSYDNEAFSADEDKVSNPRNTKCEQLKMEKIICDDFYMMIFHHYMMIFQRIKDESCKISVETAKEKSVIVKERPKWSNKTEFLMSCIQTSVGLGNIWRFPFTAYLNGGGAFLVPYVIVLFMIG